MLVTIGYLVSVALITSAEEENKRGEDSYRSEQKTQKAISVKPSQNWCPIETYAEKDRSWWAGGGIKGRTVVGKTDELGSHAIEDKGHFRDLHRTILNQLDLDQKQLTYLHLGREERLTKLHGTVIEKIV